MKTHFPLAVMLMVVGSSYSSTLKDTASDIRITARVKFSKVGLAPIPAFSFDSPILFGFLTIKKQRFSFEPDASLGLNGKPWMTNHWFRYTTSERGRWKSSMGFNPSLFFENETSDQGHDVIRVQRNLTFEGTVEYQGARWNVRLAYMNIRGCDEGALSGHFIDVLAEFNVQPGIKKIMLSLKPELFYFDFDGSVDGFFVSTTTEIKHAALPISLFSQTVLPLWANFPDTSLKWNMGLSIIL